MPDSAHAARHGKLTAVLPTPVGAATPQPTRPHSRCPKHAIDIDTSDQDGRTEQSGGAYPDAKALAGRIIQAQQAEIGTMQEMLTQA